MYTDSVTTSASDPDHALNFQSIILTILGQDLSDIQDLDLS